MTSTVSIPQTRPSPAAAAPLPLDLGTSDSSQVSARTIIGYGDSGLGKSTNARFFAQMEYEKLQRPVRLVAFEDSSKVIFEPLIGLGIVEAVFLTKAHQPLAVLRRLSRGEWPIFAPDGSIKSWVALKADQIAAYVIEGLTSGSESLLEEMREEHRLLREQRTDAFEIGGEKFAPASQSAYGFIQQEMIRALKSFGMLPVDRVLWTAHECVGSDSDTKDPIRGPGLVGKAATDSVRKYCGMLLHFDGVTAGGVTKPRIYYRKHPDAKFPNISYPAKTTVPVEMLPQLEKSFPNGYFEPGLSYGNGLDKFLRVVDGLVAQFTNSDLAQWKARVDSNQK